MKYLILRRISQLSLMFLYFSANAYGWHILEGNFGTAFIFGVIPLADPYNILQVFASGFVLGADVLIGGLIVVLFYGLIAGRAFCAWVCPVNMITDLANYLRRVLKLDGQEINYRFLKRGTRYWVMVIGLVVSAMLGISAFEIISPISIMQRGSVFGFGMGAFILVSIFLFDLFGVKNGWCGHLCPLGAFYAIVGKKSLIKVQHKHNNCTNCMDCKVVCPENHVLSMVNKTSVYVSDMDCSNCGRCVDVCNDNALEFGIRNLNFKGNENEKDII